MTLDKIETHRQWVVMTNRPLAIPLPVFFIAHECRRATFPSTRCPECDRFIQVIYFKEGRRGRGGFWCDR